MIRLGVVALVAMEYRGSLRQASISAAAFWFWNGSRHRMSAAEAEASSSASSSGLANIRELIKKQIRTRSKRSVAGENERMHTSARHEESV